HAVHTRDQSRDDGDLDQRRTNGAHHRERLRRLDERHPVPTRRRWWLWRRNGHGRPNLSIHLQYAGHLPVSLQHSPSDGVSRLHRHDHGDAVGSRLQLASRITYREAERTIVRKSPWRSSPGPAVKKSVSLDS